jgi:hypothetical protein
MYRTDYQDYLNANGTFIIDWLDWVERNDIIEKEEKRKINRKVDEWCKQLKLELNY